MMMNRIALCSTCVAALLSLALADTPCPDSDFVLKPGEVPVYIEPDGYFCYVNWPQAENEKIRRAFAEGALVKLTWSTGAAREPSCVLRRSDARVAAVLQEFAAVPQWLDWRPSKYLCLDVGGIMLMEIRDAQGKVLWEGVADDLLYQAAPGMRPTCVLEKLAPLIPFKW